MYKIIIDYRRNMYYARLLKRNFFFVWIEERHQFIPYRYDPIIDEWKNKHDIPDKRVILMDENIQG